MPDYKNNEITKIKLTKKISTNGFGVKVNTKKYQLSEKNELAFGKNQTREFQQSKSQKTTPKRFPIQKNAKQMKTPTHWGNVADWYDKMISDKDSYQNQVILPKTLQALNLQKNQTILDLGCGVG